MIFFIELCCEKRMEHSYFFCCEKSNETKISDFLRSCLVCGCYGGSFKRREMSELWFAWLWQSAGYKWSCLPIVVTLISFLSAFSPTSSTLCPFSCPSLYRFLFPLLSPVSSFDFLRAPSFPCHPSPYYSSSFPT